MTHFSKQTRFVLGVLAQRGYIMKDFYPATLWDNDHHYVKNVSEAVCDELYRHDLVEQDPANKKRYVISKTGQEVAENEARHDER